MTGVPLKAALKTRPQPIVEVARSLAKVEAVAFAAVDDDGATVGVDGTGLGAGAHAAIASAVTTATPFEIQSRCPLTGHPYRRRPRQLPSATFIVSSRSCKSRDGSVWPPANWWDERFLGPLILQDGGA
jgi:hypothetical protein